MKRISFILGTRPEAIKLCPLILAMRSHHAFAPHVCVTGQHREMLDQVLEAFGVQPDVDLSLMQPGQSLGAVTARAIQGCETYLRQAKPEMVLLQGDTTTAFSAALAAFYQQIPVAHVEAGLRTFNKHSPFPEEVNRVLTTRLADYHFAPTEQSRQNLLREGVPEDRVFVTGNTVIDALLLAVGEVRNRPPENGRRAVLITGHRRENFGRGFASICAAIGELASRFPDADFIYPVHLNPRVREPVHRLLSNRKNVHLLAPLAYLPFVALMDRADVILTDSGGVQEEAPSLGKPVLVMRDTTERPEAVATGTVRLVGTDAGTIVDNVARLLTDAAAYRAMAGAVNPYGDGHACARILSALENCVFPTKERRAA